MGQVIRKLGWAIVVRSCAVGVLIFLAATAHADDECPALSTLVCSPSQSKPGDTSCLKPGAAFVQQGNTWVFLTEGLKVSRPDSNTLNFLYAVDSNSTKQKYGLVYVGIMRVRSESTTDQNVRLSRNDGLDLPETSELLETYRRAVTSSGPVTNPLLAWETFPDHTDYVFTTASPSELSELDLSPPEDKTDVHARLYRFQSGGGLICIPFWVGAQDSFTSINGATLDLYGAPATKDNAVTARAIGVTSGLPPQAKRFSIRIKDDQSE